MQREQLAHLGVGLLRVHPVVVRAASSCERVQM